MVSSPIRQWLSDLGLDRYADLVELGVASMGHRKKILRALNALVQPLTLIQPTHLPSPSPPPDATPVPEKAESDQAERRQLTVMFCDLEGPRRFPPT